MVDAAEDEVTHGVGPAIGAEGIHLEAGQAAAGRCREQDSAVHSRHLLGQAHYSLPHGDCMELTRENRLDHLDYDFLFLCHVRHHETLVDYKGIDDTVGSQLADLLEVEGGAEGVDSCIDLQPSCPLTDRRYSLKESLVKEINRKRTLRLSREVEELTQRESIDH